MSINVFSDFIKENVAPYLSESIGIFNENNDSGWNSTNKWSKERNYISNANDNADEHCIRGKT